MFSISHYLDDQNEPFNSIWIDRILMILEGNFFRDCVEATPWGVGGIYQMYRRQRSLTERCSKTKAFAPDLFAKVVLILTSLLFLSPTTKLNFVIRLTMIYRSLLFIMLLLSNIEHILLLNISLLATNSEILHFPAPSAGV